MLQSAHHQEYDVALERAQRQVLSFFYHILVIAIIIVIVIVIVIIVHNKVKGHNVRFYNF